MPMQIKAPECSVINASTILPQSGFASKRDWSK